MNFTQGKRHLQTMSLNYLVINGLALDFHSTCLRFFAFHFSFLSFNKYRIPREFLLNKTGDVTPEGKYVTPYKVQHSFRKH